MSDPNLFRLRVSYVKQGRLALLSHLEICRALERTVRRAKLPYAISQGFSPHMKISFGAALPVGVGSTCEIFDLLLTRYVDPEQALESLSKACAPDLMCRSAVYVEPSAKAASVALPVSFYRVQLSQVIETLAVPRTVAVGKPGKAKDRKVSDYLVGDITLTGSVLDFGLVAKDEGSLRPDKFLQACIAMTNSLENAEECDAADYESRLLQRVQNTAMREETPLVDELCVVSCTRVSQKAFA